MLLPFSVLSAVIRYWRHLWPEAILSTSLSFVPLDFSLSVHPLLGVPNFHSFFFTGTRTHSRRRPWHQEPWVTTENIFSVRRDLCVFVGITVTLLNKPKISNRVSKIVTDKISKIIVGWCYAALRLISAWHAGSPHNLTPREVSSEKETQQTSP